MSMPMSMSISISVSISMSTCVYYICTAGDIDDDYAHAVQTHATIYE